MRTVVGDSGVDWKVWLRRAQRGLQSSHARLATEAWHGARHGSGSVPHVPIRCNGQEGSTGGARGVPCQPTRRVTTAMTPDTRSP